MSTRPPKTHYASSSSTDSDSSSPSSSDTDLSTRYSMDVQPVASVEVMRCLRCHRHVEATSTDDPASTGMIRSHPGDATLDAPSPRKKRTTTNRLRRTHPAAAAAPAWINLPKASRYSGRLHTITQEGHD
ncbi:hypothetical protein F5Y05DRAFT_413163 [Hypoxylon sp. FL0543]|nr:hypothetical protein F5Y05DRAFT_413163 [Hypoxylon sp. FL0543]